MVDLLLSASLATNAPSYSCSIEVVNEADKARLETFYAEHDPAKLRSSTMIDQMLSERPTAADRTKMWAFLDQKYNVHTEVQKYMAVHGGSHGTAVEATGGEDVQLKSKPSNTSILNYGDRVSIVSDSVCGVTAAVLVATTDAASPCCQQRAQ